MAATPSETIAAEMLEVWRRKLIDLSFRNRLIKYRKTKASTLEIELPSLDELLEDPGRPQPWRFYFPPEPEDEEDGEQTAPAEFDTAAFLDDVVLESAIHPDQPRAADEIVVKDINARQLNRTLETLARKANAEFQDKALRILYIAAGFLDWFDVARQEELSSPLILVPVELRRETAGHPYKLYFVDDEEIVINPSLTEKLRRDAGQELPGDWVWEDKPIATELDEVETAMSGTGWSVRRDAVIGLFSFQKYVMFRDLLDNEEAIVGHSVVRSLAEKRLVDELTPEKVEIPALDELDEVQSPQTDLAILDADSTQRRCIEAAKRGQSFVMQGPPGTGKSQTIANIISDAIGRGKRVLFVSEKAAALDVVHRRLSAEGLDEFCLMLHGEHAARREVTHALYRSLTGELVPRPGLTSHELERLAQLRELLNSTAQLIHSPLPMLSDRSMYEVLGELAELHEAPSIAASPEASELLGRDVRAEFHRLDEIFQRLADRWRVSPSAFIWNGYASSTFSTDDRARVLEVVRRGGEATNAIEQVSADVARLLGWPIPINLRSTEQLTALGEHLSVAPTIQRHWLRPDFASTLTHATQAARSSFSSIAKLTRALEDLYPSRRIDEFSEGVLSDTQGALKDLGRLAGETKAWRETLIPRLLSTTRFLARAEELLDGLSGAAEAAAQLLGQPPQQLALRRVQELADLAGLAFREDDRPDPTWLVGAGFDRLQNALNDAGPKLERYQQERRRLLDEYQPAALEIDATGLHRRFATEYTSFWARLKSSYREDARALRALRRDGKLPDGIAQDLEDLASLQALGEDIDSNEERLSRAFGSFHRGRETDVAGVKRAAAVAQRVIQLSDSRADLSILASRVGAGSDSDIRAGQLADQIQTALAEFAAGTEQVSPLIGRAEKLLGRHLALDLVRENVRQLLARFARVADLVDDFSVGSTKEVITIDEVLARARTISELHELTSEAADHQGQWRDVLGSDYRGAATDWESALVSAEWLSKLSELTAGSVPHQLERMLLDDPPRWPDFAGIETARAEYLAQAEKVSALFEADRGREVREKIHSGSLEDFARLCDELSHAIDDLYDWAEFRGSRDRAREEGWGTFLGALIDHGVEARAVAPAFRRAYWSRRLEALFEEDPDLADRGATYARWIGEFKSLDQRLVKTASDRVVAARNKLRTTHVAVGGSEVALLRNEAAKKRRHMPVRKLLAAIPTLLSELKPCLMMSPLTVSHFLSPDHRFDLVVFDEASQVPPQDAVNCIYRGAQLVVAGDSRQLPPTPFFQITEPDVAWDDEGEVSEDMESILDSCEALLPSHPLRWHYRSRHEDLISFSNALVYDGSLLTFPSADHFSPSKGVRFIHVPDGIYERGRTSTNRREARVVAERVVAHLLDSDRSVGVITFNTQQRDAVAEELDRLRIEHPEIEHRFAGDRLDEVFVKHLESVQGDERDVIVFSVGYGHDPNGKFWMNFGPLNKEGGYRRLNVAVTRGRELVEVVSSVHAADFTLSETASRGSRLLRDYIRYAETNAGSLGLEAAETRDYVSPLEATIGAAIRELGYEVVPQVGAGSYRVDLGVRDPNDAEGYVLAVTTDGFSYSSTPTARDRDRLREAVLTNLRWKVHRVWSLDWVRNREAEVGRIREALEANDDDEGATEDQDVEPVARERNEREVAELKEASDSEHLPWVVEYTRVELPKQNTDYEFHVSINREKQRDLVLELVEAEGPIHVDYAIRRLAGAWGLKRTSDRIRKAGIQAIRMAIRTGNAELRGKFIWRAGQELDVVRSPCWDDDRTWRSINEIPQEEIDLAITKLVESSGGRIGEQLVSDTGKVLGFSRTRGSTRDALLKRIRALRRTTDGATR
jgi:hypothetical protein